MSSELSLYFAGIFLSFCVQIAAAYLSCSLLGRILHRPRHRFVVWLLFLAGCAIYWIGLVGWNLRGFTHRQIVVGDLGPGSVTAAPSVFLVPLDWGQKLLLAGRVLVYAYLCGVMVLLAVALWRHVRLRLVLRYAQPASEALLGLFEQTREEHGVARCELLILPGLASPATAGWLRPRILLPAICEELGPNSRLSDVLRHELAHVARGDYLWASLADLICRLLFFHPAVWRAKKLARLQCELACDFAVIETRPEHRADYADSLAYFVRLRMIEERSVMGVDFAAAPSNLGSRIRFILSTPRSLPWWNRASRTIAGVVLVTTFALVVPDLRVLLAFTRPMPQTAPSAITTTLQPKLKHSRKPARHTPELPAIETVSRLSARSAVRETQVYSLTGNNQESGSEPADVSGGWREGTAAAQPSVVDAVRSAAIGIAIGRGRDRDRDTPVTLPKR